MKVYPADIDAVVERFPGASDVCAFGIDDAISARTSAWRSCSSDRATNVRALHEWLEAASRRAQAARALVRARRDTAHLARQGQSGSDRGRLPERSCSGPARDPGPNGVSREQNHARLIEFLGTISRPGRRIDDIDQSENLVTCRPDRLARSAGDRVVSRDRIRRRLLGHRHRPGPAHDDPEPPRPDRPANGMTLADRPRRFLDWNEHPGTHCVGGNAARPAGAVGRSGSPAPSQISAAGPAIARGGRSSFRRGASTSSRWGSLVMAYKIPAETRARRTPSPRWQESCSRWPSIALVFRAARGFRDLPRWVQRHPFVVLHVALYGSVLLVYALPLPRGTFLAARGATCRNLFPFLVWRCSYVMLAGKRGSAAASRFRDHLFYCLPIWGGTVHAAREGP